MSSERCSAGSPTSGASHEQVGARQLARLLHFYPEAQLLPDWIVAGRWLALREEEGWLRAALADLERRKDAAPSAAAAITSRRRRRP